MSLLTIETSLLGALCYDRVVCRPSGLLTAKTFFATVRSTEAVVFTVSMEASLKEYVYHVLVFSAIDP